MSYLTCTMISIVDLAHYGVSHAKDWVPVDFDTRSQYRMCYGMATVITLSMYCNVTNDR